MEEGELRNSYSTPLLERPVLSFKAIPTSVHFGKRNDDFPIF